MFKNRRTLLIVLLCLAVATALSAGTLAVYTSSVDLTAKEVTAKKFHIDANKGDSFDAQIKIAPTEHEDYVFTVDNKDGNTVSEVPIDLTMALDASKVYSVIPGATFELFEGNSVGNGAKAVYEWTASDTENFEQKNFFEANKERTQTYTLRLTWVDNATEDNTKDLQATTLAEAFKLIVTGTQNTTASNG